MVVSYSGYAGGSIAGVNGLVMGFGDGTMPDAFQPGDIMVAAVRSNRPLSGNGFGANAGWTVWNAFTVGSDAIGLFYRRSTTEANLSSYHRFDGWPSGSATVGVMTCLRGINASVSATDPNRNDTGLIPSRTEMIRPTVDLSVFSYVMDALLEAPEFSNTGGMTQGVSNTVEIGGDRLSVGLAHRENPIASSATTDAVQFNLSGPVRSQRYFSLVMRGAGATGPPTGPAYSQPFQGLYVGDNSARMYLDGSRVF